MVVSTAIIIEAMELAIKYGPSTVKSAKEIWTKDEVTMDDIEALKGKIKDPHSALDAAKVEKDK